MRVLVVLLACAVSTIAVFCDSQHIVCDNSPGEIYFSGVHPSLFGFAGFYYSEDGGEHIVLRNSTGNLDDDDFGALLADFNDGTIFRFSFYGNPDPQFLTVDGGFNWNLIDSIDFDRAYASGIIPGEIYRTDVNDAFRVERSTDYGTSFFPCACIGGPDSIGFYSAALGIDSGEVYLLGDHGKLYYCTDYAESFVCLGDLYQSHGVNTHSYLLNGQEPGEVFVWHHDTERLWRVYHYGAEVQLLANFNYGISWYCSYAASRTPGDLYFLALNPDMVPGGTMHIYHTTDNFQTWTMYEHVVNWEDVDDPQISIIPSKINLTIWPNPTNAAFNISYELNAMQDVRLMMYDILGRQVWRNDIGIQPPGVHRLSFADDELPSGRYFLVLESQQGRIRKAVTIIK